MKADTTPAFQNGEKAQQATELIHAQKEVTFRLVVESAPGAMVIVNKEGKIDFVNKQIEILLGFNRNELLGRDFEMLIPTQAGDQPLDFRNMFFGSLLARTLGMESNLFALKKNGVKFRVELSLTPLVTITGTMVLVVITEIVKKNGASQMQDGNEQRFRELFQNTPVPLMALDLTTLNFIESNAQAINLFKFSADQLKQMGTADVSPEFQPDGRRSDEKAAEFALQALKGEEPVFEWLIMDSAGAEIRCEFRLALISDAGTQLLLASFVDITERARIDTALKELNEHLEERIKERTAELSEANKAMEAFSYSVSHDLRAPVRAITSFTKLILREYGSKMEPRIKELFGFIVDSVKRMGTIIDDLLKLAKNDKEKFKISTVDMTGLVRDVWATLMRGTPHCAILQLEELKTVQADLSMIEQVVMNLISNAIKYSSKKAKPVITIWCEHTTENITYYFKDNGTGFDMENYDRLFGAFQRLHSMSEFEGTGVGLSLVKRIIEKHGGTVGAEGKPCEGATFYFTLPVA